MDEPAVARLEKSVTDFRVEMATAVTSISTKLDSMKDHDFRIRTLEAGQKSINDRMDSDDKIVLVTAKALKDADEARRNTENQSWVTPTRAVMVIGALVGVSSIVIQIVK